MRAGLGWIGKHTLLLDRAAGSYFFLAELFTDLELAASPLPADHCGTCARCHAACPTGALGPGYTMDPRRCLSYLTIEHRSALPVELRPRLGNWIFGCDLCQEACPWNGRGRRTAARRRSSRRRSLHDPGAPRAVDRRAVGALLCTDVQVDALMADPTESRALRTLVDIVESGRPLVYIRSAEEQRVTTLLREIAGRCFSSAVPLWTWSLTEGMRRDDGTGGELLGPRAALDFVATYDGRALFLFKDYHEPMREAPDVRRRLRDLYELCFDRGKVLIICSPVKFIPEEIERAIVYVELAVPDLDELVGFLRREATVITASGGSLDADEATLFQLGRALQGLTFDEARHAIRRALGARRVLDQESVPALLEEKRMLVNRTGMIEYLPAETSIEHVGRLALMKKWLTQRRKLFQMRDRISAEIVPKGVLVMGISGCGKSLSIKAIASCFELPLYRIDMIAIFSGRHGTAEGAFAQACHLL